MNAANTDFDVKFAPSLELAQDVVRLTNKLCSKLVNHQDISPFAPTAIQFALISRDTSCAIVELLRRGYIGQSYVLLRWYLEMAHLSYYLWQNPDRHYAWLQGIEVKPGSVRKYFRKVGFPDWSGVYVEWSSLLHGSSKLLLDYHKIEVPVRKRSEHDVIVGGALIYVMWFGQKINYVLITLLQDSLGISVNYLARQYIDRDDEVSYVTKQYNLSTDSTVHGREAKQNPLHD